MIRYLIVDMDDPYLPDGGFKHVLWLCSSLSGEMIKFDLSILFSDGLEPTDPFDENGDMSGSTKRYRVPMCQQTLWLVGRKDVRSARSQIGDFPSQLSWSSVLFWGGDRLVDSSPDAPGLFVGKFSMHDLEKKHIQESVSYEFCAGDAVATPLVQQLPSLVGHLLGFQSVNFGFAVIFMSLECVFFKLRITVKEACNDDGFILKCCWWCLYRGWHSSMLWIFQTWQVTKVSNIMIYMYIWYQNRERERAVIFDTYIYIYIYLKSDRNCRRLNRFCTHILKPVRKKTLASCEFS